MSVFSPAGGAPGQDPRHPEGWWALPKWATAKCFTKVQHSSPPSLLKLCTAQRQACGTGKREQETMWLCSLWIWEEMGFSSLFPVFCVFSTLSTKYYADFRPPPSPPCSIWNTKAVSGTWSWCNCAPTGATGPFSCLPTNFPCGSGVLCCAATQPRQAEERTHMHPVLVRGVSALHKREVCVGFCLHEVIF